MSMFELLDNYSANAVIKVVGVGAEGSHAVNNMLTAGVDGIDFLCVNPNLPDESNPEVTKENIKIKKLFSISHSELDKDGISKDYNRLREEVIDANLLFLVAELSTFRITGTLSNIAKIAEQAGILTVLVATHTTKHIDGDYFKKGVRKINKLVDSTILLSTGTYSDIDSENTSQKILYRTVIDIAQLILRPGLINVDFSDVKTVLSKSNYGSVGFGEATGEERARKATKNALSHPFLSNLNVRNAPRFLVMIRAGMDLAIGEFEEVGSVIKEICSETATIIIGTVVEPELEGEINVTVVVTGFDKLNTNTPENDGLYKIESSKIDSSADTIHINEFFSGEKNLETPLFTSDLKLIASENIPDEEIAELIVHLSNVYKSIGGDELIVRGVSDVPPNSASSGERKTTQKKRLAR